MRTAIIVSFLAVLMPGSPAIGQKPEAPPDFSGTWKLKKMARAGHQTSLKSIRQLTMEVTQDATSIRVSGSGPWAGKALGMVFIYYLDGRGESNRTTVLVQTTTHIVKRKLKIEGWFDGPDTKSKQGPPRMTPDFDEEWALSKNGKQLTRIHTHYLPETAGPFAVVDQYNYVRVK